MLELKGRCGFPLAEERMKRKADLFHTELGEWVQVCGGSSGHMVFQSSVVFVVIPTHPPYVCFVGCFGIFEVVP